MTQSVWWFSHTWLALCVRAIKGFTVLSQFEHYCMFPYCKSRIIYNIHLYIILIVEKYIVVFLEQFRPHLTTTVNLSCTVVVKMYVVLYQYEKERFWSNQQSLNSMEHTESANSHIVNSQAWRKTKMNHLWHWLEADKHLGGSGSSSCGLAVVSRMRTKNSNTIWLESWGESSICGSLLTQERGRDSSGSQTHLYSEV